MLEQTPRTAPAYRQMMDDKALLIIIERTGDRLIGDVNARVIAERAR